MKLIFNCSVIFLNMILPYIFLITDFEKKKGNRNGIKNFEFYPWEKNSNDLDIQSALNNIKDAFPKFCLTV